MPMGCPGGTNNPSVQQHYGGVKGWGHEQSKHSNGGHGGHGGAAAAEGPISQALGLGVSGGDGGDHGDRAAACFDSGGISYAGLGPLGMCGQKDGSNHYSWGGGSSGGHSGGGGGCVIS